MMMNNNKQNINSELNNNIMDLVEHINIYNEAAKTAILQNQEFSDYITNIDNNDNINSEPKSYIEKGLEYIKIFNKLYNNDNIFNEAAKTATIKTKEFYDYLDNVNELYEMNFNSYIENILTL